MKSSDVVVGTTVVDVETETVVEITEYKAGWVEVKDTVDGGTYKVRAKRLDNSPEALEKAFSASDAPSNTPDEQEASEEPAVDAKDQTGSPEELEQNSDAEEHSVECPFCGHKWVTTKQDNFICPNCKEMFDIKLHPNKDNYVIGLGETASGRDTMDIDDIVAGKLRGLEITDAFERTATEMCEIDQKHWFSAANAKAWKTHLDGRTEYDCFEELLTFLWQKYSHLNLGMQRMNLGNLLRGAFSRSSK